jgi:hypothetical protein
MSQDEILGPLEADAKARYLADPNTSPNGRLELADYPLVCDLLSSATTPMTTKPAAQIASITSDVEIKSSAAR